MNKNKLIKALFFIIISITLINSALGKTIYVNQQVLSNQQSGNNWEHAFVDLKIALFEAQSGDTIWVAKGTYTPVAANRLDAFFIKNGLIILGGFNGTETNLSQRSFLINETILSGERADTTQLEDNHFHVVCMTNVDSMTVLDGFTITKGYADDGITQSDEKKFLGGGLFIETTRDSFNSRPKILNCRFIKNTARRGGAIYCNGKEEGHRLVNPMIDNCFFQGNFARWAGGAISKKEGGDYFEIKNSVFLENAAKFSFGGAIHFFNPFGINKISNCHFERDSVLRTEGGAILFELKKNPSKLFIEDSKFIKNLSVTDGAAIEILYLETRICNPAPKHDISINNCIFEENYAFVGVGAALKFTSISSKFNVNITNSTFLNNYAHDGGSSIHSELITDSVFFNIEKCVFRNNKAKSGVDGNIYLRPGVSDISSYQQLTLKNSLLANNNTGAYSAFTGLFDGKVESEIVNCTFYKNGSTPIAKNWSPDFDGVSRYNNMKIVNSIFYEEPNIFNNPTPSMEEIFFNNNLDSLHLADYQFENCWINALPITICDTTCGKDLLFNQYPLFTNPEAGDFSLIPCSPTVNAGRNIAGFSATDLAGDTRIKDNIIDIGAYENDAYEQITIDVEQTNATSGTSLDGALTIENISGGTPPYQYNWNNGETTSAIQNLNPNKYDLTITDSIGCSEVFEFEISFTNSITSNEAAFSSIVYPNPVYNNTANLEITSSKTTNFNVHTYDVMGRLINSQAIAIKRGSNIHALEIPKAKGFYLLAIRDTNNNLLRFHKIQLL